MSPPYKCPRCGYSTPAKTKMYRHFMEKLKQCPAIEENIELTPDVKEYVLKNRNYNTMKKESKVVGRISLNLPTTKTSYIYLVRPKENVKNKENVYKVGKTIQASFKRIKSYGAGTELLLFKQCIDSDDMEQKILQEFNKTFPKYIFGNEYFVGSSLKMIRIIESILFQESLDSMGMDLETFNLKSDPEKIMDDVFDIDKIQKLSSDIDKINKETWETFTDIDRTIRDILAIFQKGVIDNYEKYLIKNVETPGDTKRHHEFKKHLIVYYKFIYCSDIEPLGSDKTILNKDSMKGFPVELLP